MNQENNDLEKLKENLDNRDDISVEEGDSDINLEEEDLEDLTIFSDIEEEFKKPITQYKKEIDDLVKDFKSIFLTGKTTIAENLRVEIEKIFEEYNTKHFNSLVLYCGRIYEFIIYQIGWFILKDTMYENKYKEKEPKIKDFQMIINEIKGFFKKNIGNPLTNDLSKYQKNIAEKRNDVAHPSFYGDLREIDKEAAEDVLKTLINALDFFCSKFNEILNKPEFNLI